MTYMPKYKPQKYASIRPKNRAIQKQEARKKKPSILFYISASINVMKLEVERNLLSFSDFQ